MREALGRSWGTRASAVTGSQNGGQEEGGENVSHMQTWAPPLPGWLGLLALSCQPPGCQVCPGPAVPKPGVHPAFWLPFPPLDSLVLSRADAD